MNTLAIFAGTLQIMTFSPESVPVPLQILTVSTPLIAVPLIIIGTGMIAIWLMDILSGKFKSQGNFFQWTEGEDRLWLHIMAEMLTGLILLGSGIAWLTGSPQAENLSLLGLGAVIYSCINSSGWVVHKRSRLKYGIPIWISLTISLFLVIIIL